MTDLWFSNKTQVFWTCRALAMGRTINHMDEIGEVRGWRLGAIVHNLRKNYGWPIETDYRGPDRIAHYCLRADCNALGLKYPRSAQGVLSELLGALGDAESAPEAASGQRRAANG
ncbi:MAG: hypothetical protein ACRBBV_18090 [Paracoccaceae bacterium]